MKKPSQPTASLDQLSLFGASSSQNYFNSEDWGLLTFVPCDSVRWNDTCRHCPLWKPNEIVSDDDECLAAPCNHDQRADGLDGYFAKHDMPTLLN